MQLTKHAHSCVKVEYDDKRIVIDPGDFTPDTPMLLESADAVLVTHAHGDHVSIDTLAHAMRSREYLAVYGPEAAVASLKHEFTSRVHAVVPGEAFDIGGLPVSVHDGLHAPVLPGGPREPNVGYLLAGGVYHPGDSLDPPGVEVDTLLVPISGPWMKLAEVVEFVAQVKPRRAVAIHEALLSRIGLDLVGRILGEGGVSSVPVEQFTPGEQF
ncbi:MAG: MBL fold metallo-hydrolase [Actinobacteria bacterium HGW-Actinobacteria-8]|nr:MAG: MBL fold metallo-hydrolase [Actinobacteria bacterium HGW-Actinobacteria-8]